MATRPWYNSCLFADCAGHEVHFRHCPLHCQVDLPAKISAKQRHLEPHVFGQRDCGGSVAGHNRAIKTPVLTAQMVFPVSPLTNKSAIGGNTVSSVPLTGLSVSVGLLMG